MVNSFHIVVCASIVPDPLQTLEPAAGPAGSGLKNEMMLPAVLDPWAAAGLYEAANLAAKHPGSKVWLVSLGPKAKLQQVMMTVAQKVPFELVAIDGPLGGFTDAHSTAAALAEAIAAIPGLDREHLLLFGGWESASRGAGVTLQTTGERLGITDQFQGVDQITVNEDGSFEVLERVEGGKHQVSVCTGAPAVLGWATGNLPEPRNSPQVGMANMRGIMPALQKAKRKLKNFKLKHSRLLTCYSALAYLLHVHTVRRTVTPGDVVELVRMTPTERIERLAQERESAKGHVDKIIEAYEAFLKQTDSNESDLVERFRDKRASRQLFEQANELGNLMYDLLRSIDEQGDSPLYRLLLV